MATRNNTKKASNKTAADTPEKNQGEGLLAKFFHDQLKDIYYAEQQLLKALEEMKRAATTDELEDAFEHHRSQTERHIRRLEKVFSMLDKKPEGKKCEAMDGILKEGRSIISETKNGSMTRDAALIIAAQKVEHYEIATYGGLVQLAITLGKNQAARMLDKTLQEEEDTDRLLTDIAEQFINIEAEEEGSSASVKEDDDEDETTREKTPEEETAAAY